MTPEAAYSYVRSIRPRVLLASSQWQAVQDYHQGLMNKPEDDFICVNNSSDTSQFVPVEVDAEEFDDNSLVLITESDLDGYEENHDLELAGQNMLASNAAIARLSCLWLRCHMGQKAPRKKLQSSSVSVY